MAEDPYSVLGVPRTATEDDIRKAFRKLARELHPDLNPDDDAAAERFKSVSAAYELLGDAEKRGKFDRGEIDANGEPRRYGQDFSGGGPFGGRSRRGGADDFGFADIFDIFSNTRTDPNSGARARTGGQAYYSTRGQDLDTLWRSTSLNR